MNLDKLDQAKIFLLAFTVQDLKDLCKQHRIKGFSNLNKDEIIEFILKSIPKHTFQSFLMDLEQKSLNLIISQVPKYLKKENPTKLESLRFDEKNNIIMLIFKGFRWEIYTNIQFLNLNKKNETLRLKLNCSCEYAKDGGFCSHFWLGMIWGFRKFKLNTSRWDRFNLPEVFNELVKNLDFKFFYKDNPKQEKIRLYSVEELLKTKLMGKTEFEFKDLEDLSVKEILNFISGTKIMISDNERTKPVKKKLIDLIKDQLEIDEFSKIIFNFKKNSRISEARKISVDIIKLDWGPPLNCYARLRSNKQDEDNLEIIIDNNQIKHSNCHWVYHRKNLCSHLIAFFLDLSNRNLPKTLEYLKEYSKE